MKSPMRRGILFVASIQIVLALLSNNGLFCAEAKQLPHLKTTPTAVVPKSKNATPSSKTTPATAAPPKAKIDLGLFGLTYVAYSAIYFARKPVSIVKSTLETELGFTRSQLGLIDTSLLGSYALGQVLLGSTVSRLGRTAPLVLAYALSGALTAGFGAASSPNVMAALWGLCGFCAATANPLLVLFVTDLVPPSSRAFAVGMWQTSQQVGGMLANTVASAVLVNKGWRNVFYSSGAIVSFFALPLWWALNSHGKKESGADTPSKPAPSTTAVASSKGNSPLSVPGALSVGLAYTLTKMSRYCLMMWLPYYLSSHVGMGTASAGIISAIFDLTGAFGSIFSGALVDKVLGGRMILVTLPACILTAVAFALWALLGNLEKVPNPVTHVFMMGLVGFLISGPDGILGGAASRNLVDYAGRSDDRALAAAVSGMVNGCGSFGAILQGSLTAKLVDKFGWSGLFLSLAAAMGITSIVLLDAVKVEKKALEGGNGV